MVKINFENLPSTNTPLSAENLNQMQDNIEDYVDSEISNSVSGIIKRASVDASSSYQGFTQVSAVVPSGYIFLCWLTPSSYGSVNSAYMENYWQQTTNLWQTTNNTNTASFHCGYLMVKTGILT